MKPKPNTGQASHRLTLGTALYRTTPLLLVRGCWEDSRWSMSKGMLGKPSPSSRYRFCEAGLEVWGRHEVSSFLWGGALSPERGQEKHKTDRGSLGHKVEAVECGKWHPAIFLLWDPSS